MSLESELITFIGEKEGFAPRAYLDPKGNTKNRYSVGYGHVIQPEEISRGYLLLSDNSRVAVKGIFGKDTIITQTEGNKLFQRDLQSYVTATRNVVPTEIWTKLTDTQKVALVSYTYNAGAGNFSSFFNSPTNGFKQALQSGNYPAAGAILRDRGARTSDGQVIQALITRRKEEGELIAGGPLADSPMGMDAIPAPLSSFDSYFLNNYIKPISGSGFGLVTDRIAIKELTAPYETTTVSEAQPRPIQDVVRDTALIDSVQLEGELTLIRGIGEINAQFEADTKSILSRVDGFLPSEAAFLVQYDLFELYPDLMRQQMSANANDSNSAVDYSHAWRAPGKLAITADITIPGISGFRIGQIFWIGRTYEHYKQFGAFQLFGLTEVIDVSRGWNTQLHARFNAMPTFKLVGLQSE